MTLRAFAIFSGMTWLFIGAALMIVGLNLFIESTLSQNAIILIISAALAVGYFKGKKVLAKSAHRLMNRYQALPQPVALTKVYPLPYLILVASMIGLGISLRFFGMDSDVRGFVDVAVGAALMHGSTTYFRRNHL